MSKTRIAIKGTFISLIIFFIQGVLTFWRTSVILNQYGVNVNSVVQASTGLFAYLVLLESGLGSAYLFKMYKPYAEKNVDKVYELFLGLQKKMKRVAIYMLLILVVVAIVYPYFLAQNDISYFQSASIILLLGLRFVFPYYFIIAKKNLLKAEERQYQAAFIDGSVNSLILLAEIILAGWFYVRIEVALGVGLILITLSHFIYMKVIGKKYAVYIDKQLTPSFEGDKMTNDILVHKIASIVNTNTDVFILSLINLPAVTIYSAYNAVILYPQQLINQLVENLRASIGLKLSSNDDNTFAVFRELISLIYFIALIMIPTFIILINDFIELWIGEQFLLGMFSVSMFALILFHHISIKVIYIVRDGKGLYKESKGYTLVTAISNIILSIVLVSLYSINGLLIATVITNYLIMDYGNIKLVYNGIFKKSVSIAYKDYLVLLLYTITSVLVTNTLLSQLAVVSYSWLTFLLKSIITVSLFSLFSFIFIYMYSNPFKQFIKRMISSIYRKRIMS